MHCEITGAPGTIDEAKRRKGGTRKVDDAGGAAPVHERVVSCLLDVSDDRFRLPLLELFPGCDVVAKSMGNKEIHPSGCTMRVGRKMPEIAVVCSDVQGNAIFEVQVARVKNKPELRISSGGVKMEMPLKIAVTLPRAAVQKVDDAVGVDLVFNVVVVQSDIEDEPKRKKKGGDKIAVEVDQQQAH